jgi:glycosyltransferase involved in cell wall biosynthesis
MIYVDVTGACRLSLQTGIPRTSRELYNLIKESRGLTNVMPVAWQPFTASYTRLSPKSEGLLHTPFEGRTSRRKSPSDSTLPILVAALGDLLRHTPQRVGAKLFRTSDSTLLITSIFPDNRLEYLLKLQGKPGRRLAIFHDAIPLLDPAVKGWIRGRHIKALEVFSGMDAVICVSQASEEVLKKLWGDHGMASTTTHVLPWPVPLGGPRPSWTEPPNGVPSVLSVGRLKKLKNQAVLLDACEILWREGMEFSLNLIGCEDVPVESRSILNRIEQSEQRGRPIRWFGHVSDIDLLQCYEGAMFTVFPSLEEGMGLPILESLWHGRPVICGLNEPMVSVGKGPGCLHADMRSPEELANVMGSLLKARARTIELARAAHRRPLRTWNDYFSEFEGILLEDQI